MESGFLDDIVEQPDDDAVRLIYADWLDEHDQPARAELLRVQVELARAEDEGRRRELRRREQDILREHAAGWLGESAQALVGWEFHRGCWSRSACRRRASSRWRRRWHDWGRSAMCACTTPARNGGR